MKIFQRVQKGIDNSGPGEECARDVALLPEPVKGFFEENPAFFRRNRKQADAHPVNTPGRALKGFLREILQPFPEGLPPALCDKGAGMVLDHPDKPFPVLVLPVERRRVLDLSRFPQAPPAPPPA